MVCRPKFFRLLGKMIGYSNCSSQFRVARFRNQQTTFTPPTLPYGTHSGAAMRGVHDWRGKEMDGASVGSSRFGAVIR